MISFIIPAKNEQTHLPKAINSIKSSAKKLNLNFEIVVCDNNSSDKTAEVAKKLGAKVAFLQEPNIPKAKNSAVKLSKGEILVFIDADTILRQDLLKSGLEALKDTQKVAVSCLSSFKTYPTLASYGVWSYNLFSYLFRLGVGHFMIVKKTAFAKVGGFSEDVYGYEDIEFFKKLKKAFGFKSIKMLPKSIKTSPRKFEQGHDVRTFLLGLIGASLGFKISRNKENQTFWYGDPKKTHNRHKFNQIAVLIIFVLLAVDLSGLNDGLKNQLLAQNIALLLIFAISTAMLLESYKEFFIIILLFFIEAVGVAFKVPFGQYAYNSLYWSLLSVPLYIPFAWYVIVKSVYLGLRHVLLGAIFIFFLDIILEVFATKQKLWTWALHNGNLTAPYSNYVSWFVISIVCLYIFKKFNVTKNPDRYHAVINFMSIFTYISFLVGAPVYTYLGVLLMLLFGGASLIIASSRV